MKLYSADEAAEQLNVSLRTFKRLIKKFDVQAVKTLEKGKKLYSNLQIGTLKDLMVGKKTFIKNSGVSIVSNLTTIQNPGVSNLPPKVGSGVSMSDNLSSNPQQDAKNDFSKKLQPPPKIPQIQLGEKISDLIMPIDKLSNVIVGIDSDEIEGILENRKSNVETSVTLTLPRDRNGNDIPINPTDKLIILACLSEKAAGNDIITLGRLFHDIGGGRDLVDAPKIKAAIIDSIRRLRITNLKVDLTDLIEQYPKYAESLGQKKNKNGRVILEGALIPSENITVEVNGKIAESAIHIIGTPILWRIAKMKNQLAHCEQELLNVPIRTTEQTLMLKGYLLERILKIKGSNDTKRNKRVRKLSNVILFNTIYQKCNLDGNDTRRTTEYRKTITQILDHFIARNFITDYKFIKKNGKFYSIEIFF